MRGESIVLSPDIADDDKEEDNAENDNIILETKAEKVEEPQEVVGSSLIVQDDKESREQEKEAELVASRRTIQQTVAEKDRVASIADQQKWAHESIPKAHEWFSEGRNVATPRWKA